MKKILLFSLLLTGMTGTAQCWKTISTGLTHTNGIKTDGTLWGWGEGNSGRIGSGSTNNINLPTQISTSTDWRELHAGDFHTMAIKNDGTLWGWGANASGELGGGIIGVNPTPIAIGNSTWKMVRCSATHTIGIKTDGTLWGWGDNQYGAVGDGSQTNKLIPVQISASTDWKSVSCNLSRNVAIKNDGTIWAWGFNSPTLGHELSQVGVLIITVPTQIGTGTDWKEAVVGSGHTLAIKNDGTLWTWGGGDEGQSGNGIANFFHAQVGTSNDWFALEADSKMSFAIKTDGTLWAWGKNLYGQLGDGTTTNIMVPKQITQDNDWKQVSAGFASMGLKNDGSLYAWGNNLYGSLGDGTNVDKYFPTVINQCTMSVDDPSDEKITLYPNPAKNQIHIAFQGTLLKPSATLFDIAGRKVLEINLKDVSSIWTLDISSLTNGLYILVVSDADRIVMKKKLTVNN